jgi:hypothetical protein
MVRKKVKVESHTPGFAKYDLDEIISNTVEHWNKALLYNLRSLGSNPAARLLEHDELYTRGQRSGKTVAAKSIAEKFGVKTIEVKPKFLEYEMHSNTFTGRVKAERSWIDIIQETSRMMRPRVKPEVRMISLEMDFSEIERRVKEAQDLK